MSDNSKSHNLIIENRNRISLTGVNDVYGFTEETVSINTSLGGLVIKGSGLHIDKLDLSSGEVEISGTVSAFQYIESKSTKSFIQRLFS